MRVLALKGTPVLLRVCVAEAADTEIAAMVVVRSPTTAMTAISRKGLAYLPCYHGQAGIGGCIQR